MNRTLLTLLGVVACMGCEGWKAYEAVTGSIINTAVIGGVVAGAAFIPSLIEQIQAFIAGLGL